jgi:hypothetical protein
MTRILFVGVAAFTLIAGAARAESPAAAAPARSSNAMAECPMSIPGAKVSPAATADGATLTFTTTTPARVAELRHRVHAAAEMHNKNHASGGTHGDMMGDGMMGGGMTAGGHMMSGAPGGEQMPGGMMGGGQADAGTMMPQSHATVADVGNGACITLIPGASADLQHLQSAVRVRAERMQQHGCGSRTQK